MSRGKHWMSCFIQNRNTAFRTLINDHRAISIIRSSDPHTGTQTMVATVRVFYRDQSKTMTFTPQDFGMSRRISIYNPKFTNVLKRKAFAQLMKMKLAVVLRGPSRSRVAA